MSELQPLPAPGWYDDGSGHHRWWSGTAWTHHLAPTSPSTTPTPSTNSQVAATTFVRPLKDVGIAYVFAILLSGFGAHQFYLGNAGKGIAYILLWWGGWALSAVGIGVLLLLGVFIWWIIDLSTLRSQVRSANRAIMATPY